MENQYYGAEHILRATLTSMTCSGMCDGNLTRLDVATTGQHVDQSAALVDRHLAVPSVLPGATRNQYIVYVLPIKCSECHAGVHMYTTLARGRTGAAYVGEGIAGSRKTAS